MKVAKGSGKVGSGYGLPGSGMPAGGNVGGVSMPDAAAWMGNVNGPGLVYGMPGAQMAQNLAGCSNLPFVAGQVPSQPFGFQQSFPSACCQGMPSGVSNFSRMPPGGLTPQAANLRNIADMVGHLDGNQTRILRDMLNERMGNQERMVPEFGDVSRAVGSPFVPDENGEHIAW